MVDWKPIQKPGQLSESRLIKAFLDGTFPINSHLPAERELAELLGVTRPTLREALQRLERDGFIEIQHGKPTRVRDFWIEGNLGVTIALAQYQHPLPQDFVTNLFSVRILLAPTYTCAAVAQAPDALMQKLIKGNNLPEEAPAFALYDWELHWHLTIYGGNAFYTHFINSVKELYRIIGIPYFSHQQTRDHSRKFYNDLFQCVKAKDGKRAKNLVGRVMQESADLWEQLSK